MLISEKGKFIFVHIQKCAGNSVTRVLKKNFPDTRYWHGKHGHAINGIREIGQERWSEYTSYSFVRNPWDRLVSWYSMIQGRRNRVPFWKKRSATPFKSPFWNHVVRDSHDFDSFLINCTDVIYENGCFKSFAFIQADYLSDEDGNIAVNFVGRFENLSNDVTKIFERLGIEVGKLPELNASKHDHYSNYYSQKTRDLIALRFQRDMDLFGYHFTEQDQGDFLSNLQKK